MYDRNEHRATCQNIIRKHFERDAKAANLIQLQSWHEDYRAADNYITLDTAIVKDVQSDTLDEQNVEKCLADLASHTHVAQRFCDDCQQLFENWPDLSDPDGKDHSEKKSQPGSGADWKHVVARHCHTLILEASARKGCKFCAFLMQMLRDAQGLEKFRKLERRLSMLGDEAMASLSLQNWGENTSQLLWMNLPGKISDHCNAGIALYTGFESAALESSAATYAEQRDVLDIAKDWVGRCSENHKDCKSHDSNGALPSRLVSITDDVPKLVLTAGWDQDKRPRYSTLSHCWGSEPFLRLTEQNCDALLKQVKLSELPQTFQDAIHITRQLGLSYIWIDSICIKQNNIDDWVREAGSMSSVYGNSFINIAASSATSVHGGCFVRPKFMVDGLRACLTIKPGSTLVREFRSREIYELNTSGSHLATRAWALQERILPPRTIHIGSRGAFWECKSTTASEFLPDGFPDQLGTAIINEQTRKGHFASWWRDLVWLYSAANLTYPSDKLPALSGVARRAHEERGGGYVAGMWLDEDMLAQLCWQVREPRMRPAQRAPSWAWTSVDGQCRYQVRQEGVLEKTLARVLDAKMDLLGSDPFGQVRGGCLRLACRGLLEVQLVDKATIAMDSLTCKFKPDCLTGEADTVEGVTVYLLPLLDGHSGSGTYRDGNEDDLIEEKMVLGLVLKESAESSKGWFERIGMFEFYKDQVHDCDDNNDGGKGEEELLEPFMKAFESDATHVAERMCTEILDRPLEKYIFCLV